MGPSFPGRRSRLTIKPSYQDLALDSRMVMLSVIPLSGSVRVQGELFPGQKTSGDVESVDRRRCPLICRLAKTWSPSAERIQLLANCCWKPKENCCIMG